MRSCTLPSTSLTAVNPIPRTFRCNAVALGPGGRRGHVDDDAAAHGGLGCRQAWRDVVLKPAADQLGDAVQVLWLLVPRMPIARPCSARTYWKPRKPGCCEALGRKSARSSSNSASSTGSRSVMSMIEACTTSSFVPGTAVAVQRAPSALLCCRAGLPAVAATRRQHHRRRGGSTNWRVAHPGRVRCPEVTTRGLPGAGQTRPAVTRVCWIGSRSGADQDLPARAGGSHALTWISSSCPRRPQGHVAGRCRAGRKYIMSPVGSPAIGAGRRR
jgi:hypothetical protein